MAKENAPSAQAALRAVFREVAIGPCKQKGVRARFWFVQGSGLWRGHFVKGKLNL